MCQQLQQERDLRRSSRTRNRKSFSDYFSHDDMLTEHEDDDIEEEEQEEEEYEDGSDDEYIQEEQEEAIASDDSSDNDSDDNDSGKKEVSNEASVKDINPKFACGLCSNILSDPYIIPACCHRFCCKCIQESIKAGIGPCPTCRDHSVSFQSLRRDEMMGRLLTRYKMLQEKIQKKHNTRKKRTFEANKVVQEEIDDINKATESRARKRQMRESSKNRLDDLKFRRESEAPIQFAGSKKIVVTQKGKKQKGQNPSVEFLTFNDRIRCLRDFKQEYGHVNVPKSYGGLGIWCSSMRSIKAGTSNRYKHPDFKLTKDRMKVLEEMGFRWTISPTFDEYFHELQAFKEKYGHCIVPSEFKENKTLGTWCKRLRAMKSGTQPNTGLCKLTPERIKRLDDLGFRWRIIAQPFDEYFHELQIFKEKHGHCSVPRQYKENKTLGSWCSRLRMMKSGTLPNTGVCKLTPERIKRLEDLGFRWKVQVKKPFDEYFHELQAYKEKYGHCSVPREEKYIELGNWCSRLRMMKSGTLPNTGVCKLTPDRIQRLEDLGFRWKVQVKKPFDEYFHELQAFKEKYGHCIVPSEFKENKTLGTWCKRLRAMKSGTQPNTGVCKLTPERIKRLEDLGFRWRQTNYRNSEKVNKKKKRVSNSVETRNGNATTASVKNAPWTPSDKETLEKTTQNKEIHVDDTEQQTRNNFDNIQKHRDRKRKSATLILNNGNDSDTSYEAEETRNTKRQKPGENSHLKIVLI